MNTITTLPRTENFETFCNRIQPVLGERDVNLIKNAYMIAKFAHRWQTRKETDEAGKPLRYFEHPRRVCLILIDEVRCLETAMIIASLLHDSWEDTKITPEFIEHCYSADAAVLVKRLSKKPKEGYIDRLMSYGDWRVLLVKAADRLDNLRSLGQSSFDFQRKQVEETRNVYYPILNRMIALTPAPHVEGAKHLRREIHKIVQSYRKTLSLHPSPFVA